MRSILWIKSKAGEHIVAEVQRKTVLKKQVFDMQNDPERWLRREGNI